MVDVLIEEGGHVGVGFAGFRQADVVPEGVRQGLVDDEAGVHLVVQEGAVEDGGATEQQVAGAGEEEGGREAVKIGEDRGEDGIARIGGADVLRIKRLRRERIEVAREAVEGVHGFGISKP